MAVKFSTGVQFAVAQTYGTASNVTVATNANPCVVTVADGTSFIVGDIVEFVSGWEAANNRLFRISAKSTNDLTLEGLNTVSTSRYSTGGGVGSLREITAWANITQVRSVTPQASTNEFEDISTVANSNIVEVPVAQRLGGITLELLDDPSLAFVAIVETAADATQLTGVRIVFPDASRILANGYLTYSKVPSIPTRGALTNSVDVKYASVPTRYTT